MAKILYGVAGEGSGHSTRAKEIITHLLEKGHELKIVSYDRGFKNLSQHFPVEEIFGLNFDYKNNEVRYLPTLFKNVIRLPQAQKSLEKVFDICKTFQPQIVITDFEPITCLAAHARHLPVISIDNQHRLTNMDAAYPKEYAVDAELAKAVVNLMINNCQAYLVIAFEQPKAIEKDTYVFPPILRREVFSAVPTDGDYVLVYLTSADKGIINILAKIRKKFVVYGLDKEKQERNITYKKASQDGFLRDLAGCEGLIANAGFSLISEALYLGKPYLAIPVKKQFEQVLNAHYIDQLGYGKHWDKPDREKIEAFLFNLPAYKETLRKYIREDNSKIFTKIDELIDYHSCRRSVAKKFLQYFFSQ